MAGRLCSNLANDSWQLVKGGSPDVFATPVAAGRAFLFVGAYNEAVDESAWAYRPGAATAPSEPGPTAFVPEAEHHGQRDALPLTFPDGSRIVLSYPGELRLADLGVQPDVSYYHRDSPSGPYPLIFFYGGLNQPPGANDIVLRAGAWTVVAPRADPAARDDVVGSIGTRQSMASLLSRRSRGSSSHTTLAKAGTSCWPW